MSGASGIGMPPQAEFASVGQGRDVDRPIMIGERGVVVDGAVCCEPVSV